METIQQPEAQTSASAAKKETQVSILGQFATRDFWKTLFSMIVREALSTFIMSVGSTLVYYVRGKLSPDSQSARQFVANAGGIPQQPQANPNAAFSNGYAPRPSYGNAQVPVPVPVPVNPPPFGSSQSYPGFT